MIPSLFFRVTMIVVGGHAMAAAELCVTVSDPASLPLPGAVVVAANLVTLKTQRVDTDEKGQACLNLLPEGLYSVEVSLRGFLTVKYHPVRVSFSGTKRLSAQLPFGELTEGGVLQESTLAGTLKDGDNLLVHAKICLFREGNARPEVCITTNELGEYGVIVVPAAYRFEIVAGGSKYGGTIDAAVPGSYRIRLAGPSQK